VKSFPDGASPDGIHDLGGNVWEWTTEPGTTSKQNLKTIGGGGYNMRRAALVYETQFGHPLAHHPYLGMRCFTQR
jgi:formylglycine-generating enzyme required for sulfatase activity